MQDILAQLESKRAPIAVVGLGYVGLPLAALLGRHFSVIGYDIQASRLARLRAGHDDTGEVSAADLQKADIRFVDDPAELAASPFIIIAVPTPVDEARKPDLRPLIAASETVGPQLRRGALVVYESTVYPGVTEKICGAVLARTSGLKPGVDFTLGYSPERVNPGDKRHTIDKIVKVVSAQTQDALDLAAAVYGRVVTAGIHRAPTIMTAEAAKVIENTQRDLNIALMNELAIIFNLLDIDTHDVLAAAGTKWNFLRFTPGLVGGHCIGVDPYYLTYLAQQLGYHPRVILAGRQINDGMGKYVAEQTVKQMIKAGRQVAGSRVLVLGLTFKENVPDLRNSRVIDVIRELREYEVETLVHDPEANPEAVMEEFGLSLCDPQPGMNADAIVLCVAHRAYVEKGLDYFRSLAGPDPVLVDVKSALDPEAARAAGFRFWRL